MRVWFPPGPHVVTTWSPRGTHAQVAHSPQPRHSVLQLAASWHHIAMVSKREAEKAEKEAARKKARDDKENGTVPVGMPVGLERQADAASIAAGSGPCSTLASTQGRVSIRFPDGEAAAKAFGGEQLRVLMEAVADEVSVAGRLLYGSGLAHDFVSVCRDRITGCSSAAGHSVRTCRVHEVDVVQAPVV